MLSIGGIDANIVNNGSLLTDPMSQGLEIFDLTEMAWSSQYDANAAPYMTPQFIKEFYSAKYVKPVLNAPSLVEVD